MHPLINPVAPYGYLLPNVHLFMADISNQDWFVCVSRTWICLDITRFYEEQRQPSGKSGPPMLGAGDFDTICAAVCIRCDSSTACSLCRLEPNIIPLQEHLKHTHHKSDKKSTTSITPTNHTQIYSHSRNKPHSTN